MVSLEDKTAYVLRVRSQPKLQGFYDLLYQRNITKQLNDIIEIEKIYFGVMSGISKRDNSLFLDFYSKLSRRIVDRDSPSPFVHDDGLVFSLLVGIKLFNIDETWIRNVLNVRSQSLITTSFTSLLNDDYGSRSNLPEVTIPFLELTNQLKGNESILDDTFLRISNNPDLFSNSNDFIILLTLRSYDLIIESKGSKAGDLERLKEFERTFVSKVSRLSIVLYNILLFIVIYGSIKLLSLAPNLKDTLNDLALLISLIGTSLSNVFSFFRKKMQQLIHTMLGYRKG